MEVVKKIPVEAEVRLCRGISKKTQNPYQMTVLHVETELYGAVDVVLNGKTDRAGIILSLLVNK